MNLDDLKKQLLSLGWNISTTDPIHGCNWYAWLPREQRQTLSDCACNNKPPAFCLDLSRFEVGTSVHCSGTFRLTGEVANDAWVDLRVYSVPIDKVIQSIPSAKATLFSAWEAAFSASKHQPATQPQGKP